MPTKAELEVENAELRTQLASAGGEYPHPECERLCPCGVRHTCSRRRALLCPNRRRGFAFLRLPRSSRQCGAARPVDG